MKQKNYFIHIAIWVALVLFRWLVESNNEALNAFIISTTLYSIYAITFYGSSLIQKYTLDKKKYLLFILEIATLFIVCTVLLRISFKILDFKLMANIPIGVSQYGAARILFVILASFVYRFAVNKQEAEHLKNKVLLEKTETELQFLKNQINPHFFFNTLNNIYGLSYNSNPKAPEAIIKLSNAMRYIIYETQSNRVPLIKELEFINNYLELERLRLTNPDNLLYNAQVNVSAYSITPLILLPFIENCFKHGDIVNNSNGKVEINIWIENDYLNFSCVNSFEKQVKQKYGGIGNSNVEKRLHLIYGNTYKLEKQIENQQYFVFLELPLNI